MKIKLTLGVLLILGMSAMSGVGIESPPHEISCRTRADLVGKCFEVHGRLSVYNGTPSIRLWPIGTKRLLGIIDPRNTSEVPGPSVLPIAVKEKLDWDKDVFAEFVVCPLTRTRAGRMQTVCIESARNVFVREHK